MLGWLRPARSRLRLLSAAMRRLGRGWGEGDGWAYSHCWSSPSLTPISTQSQILQEQWQAPEASLLPSPAFPSLLPPWGPKALPQMSPSPCPSCLLQASSHCSSFPQLPSHSFPSHRKATSGGRELPLSTVGPPGAKQKVFNNVAVEVVCEWNPSDLRGTVAQTRPHLLFLFWKAPDNCQLSRW